MNTQPISDLLDELKRETEGNERVTLHDVVQTVSGRSLGPPLLLIGLLMISPVAGIPGVPTALALLVVFICAQLLAGFHNIWLPSFLRNKGFKREKAVKGLDNFARMVEKVERFFKPRLEFLVSKPFRRFAAVLAIVLAVCTPPLELLPFMAAIPGLAIFLIGLAVTTHDGLVMLTSLMVVVGGLVGGVMHFGG